MEHHDVIIVGGGPAGASCAWRLIQAGTDVLVLEKQEFPRVKLCAGWITAKVLRDLETSPADYPHGILKMEVKAHIAPLRIGLRCFSSSWDNYSIRRIEFDNWLLQRSRASIEYHAVNRISRESGRYVIDGRYSCDHLVGAGGTLCPVRRNLFHDNRVKSHQIATLELEFEYILERDLCHLFFFYNGLRGYAWFVPKAGGYVNVGLGGMSHYFKKPGNNIHDHFRLHLQELVKLKLLDRETADGIRATGHPYYIHTPGREFTSDNCYLIGDAAGLASVDLGEGIGPAVESGLMAAGRILGGKEYRKEEISRNSLRGPMAWLLERVLCPPGTDVPVRGAES